MDSARPGLRGRDTEWHQPTRIRVGWCLLVAVVAAAWVPELGREYARLAHPPAAALPALEAAQLTARANAWYHTGLDVIFGVTAVIVGGLIVWRHPKGRGALVAVTLGVWGPANGLIVESMLGGPWWVRAASVVGWSAFIACGVLASRLHGSVTFEERQRARWVVYGAAMSLVGIAVVTTTVGSSLTLAADEIDRHMTGHLLLVAVGWFFPASVGIAWLSPRTPDPDTLIRRTLVYGALSATILAASIGLIVAPAFFFYQDLGAAYLLLLVVAWAVLVVPLQQLLQRTVNRLMYGQRDEPVAVLNELGRRLELGTPESVLATIVDTAAATLKLPAIAIRAHGDHRTLARTGRSELEPVAIPIVYQGEHAGDLLAWPRARDEALHPPDMELLQLLARQAGATVHAVELTRELQQSRQQIVTSREDERRRMRRDLHDGLGPALAAIAMQADTAHAIVASDPRAAGELMSAVTEQSRAVIGDLRRLVYELRPPSLDQFGLRGAIQRLAEQHTSPTLRVVLQAPMPLPRLEAAVEVAVYRIVAEALTNVARHADASGCTVTIEVGGAAGQGHLLVTVEDDGVGIAAGAAGGVGLPSMRERATELGGTFEAGRREGAGTRIDVRLPVGIEKTVEASDGGGKLDERSRSGRHD